MFTSEWTQDQSLRRFPFPLNTTMQACANCSLNSLWNSKIFCMQRLAKCGNGNSRRRSKTAEWSAGSTPSFRTCLSSTGMTGLRLFRSSNRGSSRSTAYGRTRNIRSKRCGPERHCVWQGQVMPCPYQQPHPYPDTRQAGDDYSVLINFT